MTRSELLGFAESSADALGQLFCTDRTFTISRFEDDEARRLLTPVHRIQDPDVDERYCATRPQHGGALHDLER